MTYKQPILVLLTLSSLGIALWTSMLAFKRPSLNIIKTVSNLPDAYMEDVSALIMDKQGHLKIKIVTPRMDHFNDNDTSYLVKPKITLYRNARWPWYITAKTATAAKGIEQIDFENEVIIHHPADAKTPATVIRTNFLTVYPDEQIAKTHDNIAMDQPDLTIKAVGMIADMNTGSIKLLSNARGQYDPVRL